MSYQYIRFFKELTIDDVPIVGGKNASLGEMYRELTEQGVKVPNGFAITAEAYMHMLDKAGAMEKLHAALDDLDPENVYDLAHRGAKARRIVYNAGIPDDLKEEILAAYRELIKEYGEELSLAVRSSATAEDLPTASFAGQQDTYLNVKGDEELLDACRHCFASLFTDRAIHYRVDQGFDHFDVALSIGVMKMVRSDISSSGVMFSLDTETGFRDVVFITGAYGLGENVVQGAVDPDEFYVHKATFEKGYRHVLRRVLGAKKIKMIYAPDSSDKPIKNISTPVEDQSSFCITDEDVLKLADYAIKVERHYTERAGTDRPMDMEWAKDGIDGELYMVQARPETVASQAEGMILEEFNLKEKGEVITEGRAVGTRIAAGKAKIISDISQLGDFEPGDVLVSDITTPDWEPVMKQAAAIVTNRGGRTCHAAIVSRELGIPAVVGCEDATVAIKEDAMVTVSCAEGDVGRIYQDKLRFEVEKTDLSSLGTPKTEIMLNLGNPEIAFKTSFIPNQGVGLARMEFIINEYIKAHPMALIHPKRVKNTHERKQILSMTQNFSSPEEYFVEQLAEGVGTLAAAFYPKPVVVRLSDFKSNEYAAMLGGKWFEPVEANPMIGFRGAARYTHPDFAEAFSLECMAMKRVRDEMGLTNVRLMVPFCRRVDEGRRVIETMAKNGLVRGENDLKIYVMCEIPNNVIQIDAFSEIFDGFSIGSNDLTQLALGVDRDSEIVAPDYDERDEGVLQLIRMAVEGAARNDRHSGFCGQAPSDYPEMAEYLVELGIDSISLNPDTVLKTTMRILEVEERLGR